MPVLGQDNPSNYLCVEEKIMKYFRVETKFGVVVEVARDTLEEVQEELTQENWSEDCFGAFDPNPTVTEIDRPVDWYPGL